MPAGVGSSPALACARSRRIARAHARPPSNPPPPWSCVCRRRCCRLRRARRTREASRYCTPGSPWYVPPPARVILCERSPAHARMTLCARREAARACRRGSAAASRKRAVYPLPRPRSSRRTRLVLRARPTLPALCRPRATQLRASRSLAPRRAAHCGVCFACSPCPGAPCTDECHSPPGRHRDAQVDDQLRRRRWQHRRRRSRVVFRVRRHQQRYARVDSGWSR